MSINTNRFAATGLEEAEVWVDHEATVMLWCITQGIVTTQRLPEMTMFSEREYHGYILSLADEELVGYARSHWWQTGYDGETVFRRHKRAWVTDRGQQVLAALETAERFERAVLDEYVIGDPADLSGLTDRP